MTEILFGSAVVVALVLTLSIVVMTARTLLMPAKPATLTVNGAHRIDTVTGEKLLAALKDNGVLIPSACAGAGTCGLCRVTITEGGPPTLPVEAAKFTKAELREGLHLACQVTLRDDMAVQVPGELIGARLIVMGEITEFSRTTSGNRGSVGVAAVGERGVALGLAPTSSEGVVSMDVRIVDSELGQVMSTFSVRKAVKRTSLGLRLDFGGTSIEQQSFTDSPLGKALREALVEVTRQIVAETDGLPWQGRVVDFDGGEVAINAGARDGIAIGERYEIYRVTKVLRDPATGRVLGARKRHIGALIVDEVDDQLAFGRFTPGAHGQPQPNDLVTL